MEMEFVEHAEDVPVSGFFFFFFFVNSLYLLAYEFDVFFNLNINV
jgi:hypothetical protein